MFYRSIHWFRRDLRLIDNRALTKACLQSKEVISVFVFDTNILKKLKQKDDKRVFFIFESLQEIKKELLSKGSNLIILHGDPVIEIPKLAHNLSVNAVFTNKDYEPYTKDRDNMVNELLLKSNIKFFSYKDQVIFEEKEILNISGEPYKVFTPYKNAWLKKARESNFKDYSTSLNNFIDANLIKDYTKNLCIEDIGFKNTNLITQPGRISALEKIQIFSNKIKNYDENRNNIDFEGTSQLSIYLRFGLVSIRELFRFANKHPSNGAEVWKSELIWRDFYQMILSQFPHVTHEPFKREYKSIIWQGSEGHFIKWCEGQTGYPIIDAAMRYFNQTGWMHNRLRMIVASFLTKDLLVDYRKGEEYFAQKLLDFDLASNNGGWQWSASTGCDAQPYFRVFNPETQSKNFDPNGLFIKKHCPELALFSDKHIHAPYKTTALEQIYAKCKIGENYPEPIVNHDKQRLHAIEMFKI